MPDVYTLNSPQGSAINIGSYVLADPGPDFGAKDLVRAAYSENPLAEGGVLAYESVGVRRMTFPMRVASGAFGGVSLTSAEELLRKAARPGATLDIQLDGSAEAIRFDVLTGRWVERYNTRENSIDRRTADLEIDVQPYGYLPTWIILASTASMSLPGSLPLTAPALGDMPGQTQITVRRGTTGVTLDTDTARTWRTDALAFSFSNLPLWFPATAITLAAGVVATTALASNAPAGVFRQANLLLPASQWSLVGSLDFPVGSEPGYRGRYRVLAYTRLGPEASSALKTAGANMVYGAADTSPKTGATAIPIMPGVTVSTVIGGKFSQPDGDVAGAPHDLFQLIDFGEVTLPAGGSGVSQDQSVRLWARPVGSFAAGLTRSSNVRIGGVLLLNNDAAGVTPRGVLDGMVVIDSSTRRIVSLASAVGGGSQIIADLLADHRGALPNITPTAAYLNVLSAGRPLSAGYATSLQQIGGTWPALHLTLDPTFSPSVGGITHSIILSSTVPYINCSPASGGVIGDTAGALFFPAASVGVASRTVATAFSAITDHWTLSVWAQAASLGTPSSVGPIFSTKATGVGGGHTSLRIPNASTLVLITGASWGVATVQAAGMNFQPSQFYNIVAAVACNTALLYVNASQVASSALPTGMTELVSTSSRIIIGGDSAFGPGFGGVIQNVVAFPSSLQASQVEALFFAGRNGAASHAPYHSHTHGVAASVRYRPRFAFQRGF